MSTDANYMVKEICEKLVGFTIVGAIETPNAESFGLRVRRMSDREELTVWVDCDAEGNGPGWLDIQPALVAGATTAITCSGAEAELKPKEGRS